MVISECTFADFELLREANVVLDLSMIGLDQECDFQLPVFAYPTDTTDTFRNDFTAPLLTLSNRFDNAALFLEQLQSDCTWLEVDTLDDNTLGTLSTFSSRPSWLGYTLQWHLVESLHGVGCYRIRAEYDDVIGGGTNIEYSYRYVLKLYNDNLADKTIKLTYEIQGGKQGDTQDDANVIDYGGISWEREVRFKGFFGYPISEYSQEEVRFKNGANEWVSSEQVEKYKCYIKPIPNSLHKELKVNALQADKIEISDYNLRNQLDSDHRRVILDSNYEPNWAPSATYIPVEIQFKQYFQNFKRERC